MLIRKMLRDVWKNKVPFVAIFLMMFAGNFIFSGITSEYNGMNKSFHSFSQQAMLISNPVKQTERKPPEFLQAENKGKATVHTAK